MLAAVGFAFIALHLTFLAIVLTPILLLRTLVPSLAPKTRRWSTAIYLAAVRNHSWWLKRVAGAKWTVPDVALDAATPAVLISNHRSWSDAFVITDVVCRHGLIVKFLVKRELARIPILAVIFAVFDFPVLKRSTRSGESDGARREHDRSQMTRLTDGLSEEPAAMLSFVEGTRFTNEKRAEGGAPYSEVLAPRPGGLAMMVEALRGTDARLVDITLRYRPPVSFWKFIGGFPCECEVRVEQFLVKDLPDDVASWLVERWTLKDRLLLVDD